MAGIARQFDFTDLVGTPAGACRQVLDAGTVVFRQGEPAESIYFLASGRIRLSAVSVQGREAIITVLESDEFFGEDCLLSSDARRMTAVALTASSIVKIRKDAARSLMSENAGFDEFLITRLVRRALRIEEQLLDQMFNSAEIRLARALLSLSRCGENDTRDVTIPKLSQEILAEMVGSTRPRVNQFMNKFRKLGYIDYTSTTITVHHSLLTALLCDAKDDGPMLEPSRNH